MAEIEEPSYHSTGSPDSLRETRLVPITEPFSVDVDGLHQWGRVEPEPAERGLLEYRHVFWRRRWTVLGCLLAGLTVGGVVTVYEQPTYVARTTLEFQPRPSKTALHAESADESYDESAIATYEHVLQSRSLRQRVVQRLQNQPARVGQVQSSSLLLQGIEKSGLNIGAGTRPPSSKAALAQAARTLKAKAIPQTRIVEITAESALPWAAADFANGLVNEFIDEDLQSHWNSTQSTNKQLTDELQQLRARMEQSEGALSAYTQKTGITFTSATATLVDDEMKRTQQDLASAENDRVGREAKYKIALATPPDALGEATSDPVLQQSENQLADLKRQYADVATTFTPAYFGVKRIEAQISEVTGSIDKERANVLQRLKSEYDEAVGREAMLAATYQKHVAAATEEAQRVLQYETLKNDFDANRQLYESVLQRSKELDITSAVHASNIRVIDTAETPTVPDRPNLLKNLGFGVFTGLVFGIAMIFWKEHVSATLWGPGESTTSLQFPELGVIPSFRFTLDRHRSMSSRLRALNPLTTHWGVVTEHSKKAVEVAGWNLPAALMAESFRRTVASILFSRKVGSASKTRSQSPYPKVIVVTSPEQSDGKSTVSSNLAVALAEIKLRVILIDCDLRNPSLHKIFDVANTWGISNILEENTDIEKLPAAALSRETKIAGLHILSSGPPSASISQVLFSARLPQLLKRCRQEFDVAVVDTPPLLRVSDARALSHHADGVVLVLRAGRSKLKAALASKEVLVQDGARVLGTILNDWDPRTGGDYHLYDGYYEPTSKVAS